MILWWSKINTNTKWNRILVSNSYLCLFCFRYKRQINFKIFKINLFAIKYFNNTTLLPDECQLEYFFICFRHKRQSWWSSLHAQVGISPIGEADFCTTKRRHLPLHDQKLSGDQRSKGVYHPCELPSDIFHSSWFLFALGTTTMTILN